MKIGKLEVINSPATRIEMRGGSSVAVVLTVVAVVVLVGAVKVFQLHTELERDIEKMKGESKGEGHAC